MMGFSTWFPKGIFPGEAQHMINLLVYDMKMALRKISTYLRSTMIKVNAKKV